MKTWYVVADDKEVALQQAGGRRQAIHAVQARVGGEVHYNGSFEPSLIGSSLGRIVKLEPSRRYGEGVARTSRAEVVEDA